MIRVGIFIALTIQCVFSRCDVGWTEDRGNCYAFSNEAISWLQAASACQVYNARLVQIESQTKNDYIVSLMAAANIDSIWLGGSCRFHTSYWEWVPSLKPVKSYTNWNTGEPNNPQVEQCIEMNKGRGYRWNDLNCGSALRFACEKRATTGTADSSAK